MDSFPAKQFFCFRGIGPECRQVTIAARTNNIRKFNTIYLLEGIHQFQNGDSVSGAQIDCLCAIVLCCMQ